MTPLMVVWIMWGTVCAYPPYPDRNSCHGTQSIGMEYANEAACKAAIPGVLKEKHVGYRVSEPVCVSTDPAPKAG